MRIAFRWPNKLHPYAERPELPPDARARLFAWGRDAGFDGTEVSALNLPPGPMALAQADEIRDELAGHQLQAAAYRGESFNFTERATRQERLDRSFQSVEIASRLGADVLDVTLPGRLAQEAVASVPMNWMLGGQISVGSARLATDEEFELTASALAEIADAAAEHGIVVAVEVHQYCYADSSEPTLRILDAADRPNAGANPDLGNIIWTYATPEETSEEAITRLAPRTVYVHVKNSRRVYLPDLDRTVYVKETVLGDGSVDWRFALAALAEVGYGGWLAMEGNTVSWDFEWAMEQNIAYLRSVLERVGAASGR